MADCIFCKIVNKEIPATVVYEDEDIFAFNDINPHAPIHVLVIPKKHIASLAEVSAEDGELLGKIQLAAVRIAELLGIEKAGYRLLTNSGPDSGQEVAHLHYHLLGGKFLGPFWSN